MASWQAPILRASWALLINFVSEAEKVPPSSPTSMLKFSIERIRFSCVAEILAVRGGTDCPKLAFKKLRSAAKPCKTRIPCTPGCTTGGPLHLLDVDGQWGAWAIFSHAECSAIAKDPRLSAKRAHQMLSLLPPGSQSEFNELARMLNLWLIFMDAPEHTRLRKLLNKGFAPAAVEGLRTQVEAIVDRHADSR